MAQIMPGGINIAVDSQLKQSKADLSANKQKLQETTKLKEPAVSENISNKTQIEKNAEIQRPLVIEDEFSGIVSNSLNTNKGKNVNNIKSVFIPRHNFQDSELQAVPQATINQIVNILGLTMAKSEGKGATSALVVLASTPQEKLDQVINQALGSDISHEAVDSGRGVIVVGIMMIAIYTIIAQLLENNSNWIEDTMLAMSKLNVQTAEISNMLQNLNIDLDNKTAEKAAHAVKLSGLIGLFVKLAVAVVTVVITAAVSFFCPPLAAAATTALPSILTTCMSLLASVGTVATMAMTGASCVGDIGKIVDPKKAATQSDSWMNIWSTSGFFALAGKDAQSIQSGVNLGISLLSMGTSLITLSSAAVSNTTRAITNFALTGLKAIAITDTLIQGGSNIYALVKPAATDPNSNNDKWSFNDVMNYANGGLVSIFTHVMLKASRVDKTEAGKIADTIVSSIAGLIGHVAMVGYIYRSRNYEIDTGRLTKYLTFINAVSREYNIFSKSISLGANIVKFEKSYIATEYQKTSAESQVLKEQYNLTNSLLKQLYDLLSDQSLKYMDKMKDLDDFKNTVSVAIDNTFEK